MSTFERIFLANEEETVKFGRQFASFLKPGMILRMFGGLGAGKTTFVRGLVEGLGGDPDLVHSPTFSIVHEYESPTGLINHCDFYRLEEKSYLTEFGGLEFFEDEKYHLIEWPEKIILFESITPERLLDLHFEVDSKGHFVRFSNKK